jgi:hypothetical protein
MYVTHWVTATEAREALRKLRHMWDLSADGALSVVLPDRTRIDLEFIPDQVDDLTDGLLVEIDGEPRVEDQFI